MAKTFGAFGGKTFDIRGDVPMEAHPCRKIPARNEAGHAAPKAPARAMPSAGIFPHPLGRNAKATFQ
ncbi:MAG: hypothetical protein H6901_00575 [Rhodobacteraceae bacterium]|nr:hypothetical protein [Paracoccaceae bacterium]MCP5340700.1 hypothetical protein [Paracoccaceae bacterium]